MATRNIAFPPERGLVEGIGEVKELSHFFRPDWSPFRPERSPFNMLTYPELFLRILPDLKRGSKDRLLESLARAGLIWCPVSTWRLQNFGVQT